MNIVGENDEKPICTPNFYFMSIPVDLKVGTNIQNFKLTCTDLDSSPRSFRYSIGSGISMNKAGPSGEEPGSGSLLIHCGRHSVGLGRYILHEESKGPCASQCCQLLCLIQFSPGTSHNQTHPHRAVAKL